jgi:hypothetical protein
MSYRKSKKTSAEARTWAQFVQAHQKQLEQTELPTEFYETREMWNDFLMHGYIDHHDDVTGFTIDMMSETARTVLADVVVAYLAEFGDPGIMLFGPEQVKGIKRRALQASGNN